MIDKTVRINLLYDFYQSLLTEKQDQYMTMYYQDDWSLGEIADHFQVSRQAVYDNIRRTEAQLEDYESKLRLLEKHEARKQGFNELKRLAEDPSSVSEINQVIESLENLE
ncbi:putative DNA-binding protein [Texcoconibacillus texcoconensis]|uniref:UPF0122 protein HNQ41_000246 n=1 Tax=Texcoconibacillus texcoconensis TaxID=1095777 RepID=A0A840QL69_9BACI|nr:putative DNA-binding protein [Texcoconibacillus texcoconensis]MBB5172106.1 hypothetical protein [Texcoconibacillus texcoconensis]